MSRKCQVRTLAECALSELVNCIISAIGYAVQNTITATGDNNDLPITMVEINSYLEAMRATSNVYQDVLRIILASDFLAANIRFACLQMLLNNSVHTLQSEIFPFSYYEKILQVIAAQGMGLRSLNLKGVWVKEEHMNYMLEIIEKCVNLKKLNIPYIANDNLLECIAKYCKYLKILEISGETDITDIGIEALCLGVCRDTLTVVDIGAMGQENVCHTDVAMLLSNLKNLQTLSTYSYVGKSLLYIHENENPEFRTKLQYLHDTKTNDKILDVIIKMCPQLQSIYLDTPDAGILYKLNGLKELQRFKIHKFCCKEFLKLLEMIGEKLVHLTVIKGHGTLDIGRIAQYCYGLINIDCYMMDLITYICDRKFENLQGLEMLNSPMAASSLKHFICNTITLKRLAVDTISFTDEDMSSIFIEHDFRYLEDIWFTSAPNLTIQSIEILMERCHVLQSIGQLSGWALTPDDLSLLRALLKSGNSCLLFMVKFWAIQMINDQLVYKNYGRKIGSY